MARRQIQSISRSKLRPYLIAAAVLICLICIIWSFLPPASQDVNLSTFYEEVSSGSVESVEESEGYLYFRLADDETLYRTQNPDNASLKEMLLLAGVTYTSAVSSSDIADLILDIIFDVAIVAAIVFAVYKLSTYSSTTFKVVRSSDVSFDDIAGMQVLKQELAQIVDLLKNPQAYAGTRRIKGVILEGPPGNGKTLIARALAHEAGVAFIPTRGADFQSAFMSLGARKIRTLFRKGLRARPCIIFIDEFDSIGERRNYAGSGIDKENNRIITAMLNEMDGFATQDGVLVIAATNSYRSLDQALIRPGRFDITYTVGNPDIQTIRELIVLYTRDKVMDPALTEEKLAPLFLGQSCAAIETILNEAALLMMLEHKSAIDKALLEKAAGKVGTKLKG